MNTNGKNPVQQVFSINFSDCDLFSGNGNVDRHVINGLCTTETKTPICGAVLVTTHYVDNQGKNQTSTTFVPIGVLHQMRALMA